MQTSDWIALSSAVIALCVFFITIWQAWFTRQHAAISVKPVIITSFAMGIEKTETETYIHSYNNIENGGLGPARITTFKYFLDDNEINLEELPLAKTRIEAILNKYLSLPNHTIISSADYRETSIIKVGKDDPILHITTLEKDYHVLQNEIRRLRFYIEYEDFFGNAQPPIK